MALIPESLNPFVSLSARLIRCTWLWLIWRTGQADRHEQRKVKRREVTFYQLAHPFNASSLKKPTHVMNQVCLLTSFIEYLFLTSTINKPNNRSMVFIPGIRREKGPESRENRSLARWRDPKTLNRNIQDTHLQHPLVSYPKENTSTIPPSNMQQILVNFQMVHPMVCLKPIPKQEEARKEKKKERISINSPKKTDYYRTGLGNATHYRLIKWKEQHLLPTYLLVQHNNYLPYSASQLSFPDINEAGVHELWISFRRFHPYPLCRNDKSTNREVK